MGKITLRPISRAALALTRRELLCNFPDSAIRKSNLGRILLDIEDEALPSDARAWYGTPGPVLAADLHKLRLYASGKRHKKRGEQLGQSPETIRRHALRAARALGGESIAHGIRFADDYELLDIPPVEPRGSVSPVGLAVVSLISRGVQPGNIQVLSGQPYKETFQVILSRTRNALGATIGSLVPLARRSGYLYPDYDLMGWERPQAPAIVADVNFPSQGAPHLLE